MNIVKQLESWIFPWAGGGDQKLSWKMDFLCEYCQCRFRVSVIFHLNNSTRWMYREVWTQTALHHRVSLKLPNVKITECNVDTCEQQRYKQIMCCVVFTAYIYTLRFCVFTLTFSGLRNQTKCFISIWSTNSNHEKYNWSGIILYEMLWPHSCHSKTITITGFVNWVHFNISVLTIKALIHPNRHLIIQQTENTC